ncbi:hypothetical protein ACFLWF_00920 [Chloroflexota bacterium]
MFIFFLVIAMVLIIGSGVGLFYTNTNVVPGNEVWVIGNIAFGTLFLASMCTIIMLAIFNRDFD